MPACTPRSKLVGKCGARRCLVAETHQRPMRAAQPPQMRGSRQEIHPRKYQWLCEALHTGLRRGARYSRLLRPSRVRGPQSGAGPYKIGDAEPTVSKEVVLWQKILGR